jgi:hypothetical protein
VNKTKTQYWKWAAGIVVTLLLLWYLYRQIRAQLDSGQTFSLWPEGTSAYFFAALCLLPVNVCLEALKWQRLVATAEHVSFGRAMSSMLSGIAVSILTPNRIGEYPARIMQLKEHDSTRLVSVSVLGACAQLLALMIAGVAGLAYYYLAHPSTLYLLVLLGTVAFTLALSALYLSFERWSPWIENIRWLKKLRLWARLLYRFSRTEQVSILGISVLRFAVFTTQYWLLLHWQGIPLPVFSGLMLCTLFFWAMAIIPSIALAELGIRGTVSLFLFRAYSSNVAGIATATFVLWCMNLMLPALIGSILFFRKTR